jgi:hypothetical protein
LPFSLDALQAALRRYLSWPALWVGDVVPARLGGGVSGSPVYRLDVSYHGPTEGGDLTGDAGTMKRLSLVLKRGAQHTGAILAGSARREVHFYRTLAGQLSVRTPRLLLTADDIVGEPTAPLVLDAPGGGHGWDWSGTDTDWVLMEALPPEMVWPQAAWGAEQYRAALGTLAHMHAEWWGRPPDPQKYPWIWMPMGGHTTQLVSEARAALLEIEQASWGEKFLPADRLRAWLQVLDNPASLLNIADEMPQTLIHGDYWPGNIAIRQDGPAVFDWQLVGVGPASYDVACFHSSSRWWFGRLPLSLVEMRTHYLNCLNEHLGHRVDRYAFDMGMDAARAWRFAVLWPTVIVENHVHLLARINFMRATAIEPAYASLRRAMLIADWGLGR